MMRICTKNPYQTGLPIRNMALYLHVLGLGTVTMLAKRAAYVFSRSKSLFPKSTAGEIHTENVEVITVTEPPNPEYQTQKHSDHAALLYTISLAQNLLLSAAQCFSC